MYKSTWRCPVVDSGDSAGTRFTNLVGRRETHAAGLGQTDFALAGLNPAPSTWPLLDAGCSADVSGWAFFIAPDCRCGLHGQLFRLHQNFVGRFSLRVEFSHAKHQRSQIGARRYGTAPTVSGIRGGSQRSAGAENSERVRYGTLQLRCVHYPVDVKPSIQRVLNNSRLWFGYDILVVRLTHESASVGLACCFID